MTTPDNTKFFTVGQNNSGGDFDFNEEKGITHSLIVEAKDKGHAEQRFSEIISSYNPSASCPCCGERWPSPEHLFYDDDLFISEYPSIYGYPVSDYQYQMRWMPDGKEACVHFLDGRKEWH
jgi:hypothetical protein